MSKSENIKTLCTKGNWHFYIKDENRKAVYLNFYLGHNDIPSGQNITFEAPVEIKIPIDVWREIVLSWNSTKWGKNKNLDNTTQTGRILVEELLKAQKEKDK